ncbi:hypothetical protein ABL840_00755 [Variovorax sp. NFACC27]|uniref:hypothetical protein n=1 Tax=unclassified Variovorax TaxID=663243 RepID=UPI000898F6CE|nr:hypothetical protein SAMN03159371_01357 [Variovorax sp. NFACC28]SEF90292.1 hypothetical protein SAMN03159365_00884 [Variovorax sp. NFACC29]SFB88705.1 hypothetical protein SAMN03159379_00883 [Variovorax sp. NFACC26]SFF84586.1 hypothetical protein SAMN03159447_00540 [Variovorax sp. NFACC27]
MTQPTKVEAVALPVAVDDYGVSEIVRIDYAARKLTVVAQAPKSNTLISIRFDDVVAYRVMDERDLAEYWPACSSPNCSVFSIQSGGWLSQESTRPGSCIGLFYGDVREYLVTSVAECVSVLCIGEPRIEPEYRKS